MSSRFLALSICSILWMPLSGASAPKLAILGFDGLDAERIERGMADGSLPAFGRLAASGTFQRIAASVPVSSAVAWSNVCLGVDPGSHGLTGDTRRAPDRYAPLEAAVEYMPGKYDAAAGLFEKGYPRALRSGIAFWRRLDDAGIRATVYNIPCSFPPEPLKNGRIYCAQAAPDARLGAVRYTVYTNANISGEAASVPLHFNGHRAFARIDGPWIPEARSAWKEIQSTRTDELGRLAKRGNADKEDILARLAELDAELAALAQNRFASTSLQVEWMPFGAGIQIEAQGLRETLAPGEWSEPFALEFDLGKGRLAYGVCKFYLAGRMGTPLGKKATLLCSPIQMHPDAPYFALSHPGELARDLAGEREGIWLGGAEWVAEALQEELISDEGFAEEFRRVLDRREKELLSLFKRDDWDLFFGAISEAELSQRMFWRAIDPRHPRFMAMTASQWGQMIDETYRRLDKTLGEIMDGLPEGARLAVFSTHGIAPLYKTVNLNNALLEVGFLRFLDPNMPPGNSRNFSGVDWTRTRAYALGAGQVYINLWGREAAGCVERGKEAQQAKLDVAEALLSLRDPETGEKVVSRVFDAATLFDSGKVDDGPDLFVAFRPGYGADALSISGSLSQKTIQTNSRRESGVHQAVEPEAVPGFVAANWAAGKDMESLYNLAPLALGHFGVEKPESMSGKKL